MTDEEMFYLTQAIREALPENQRSRLKAIHVDQKLHQGHLTVRIFMHNQTHVDPKPYIWNVEELI